MNYLVIDLEMCKVAKHYRTKKYKYANEIIQIGAVLLDEYDKQIGTLSQYVHPEHGVIDHFIADLTGIQNSNVKNAPLLKEVLIHMINWLGDREYKVIAWSETDRNQLLHEIVGKDISDEKIDGIMKEDRWMDYQEIFGKRYDFGRNIGLEEALILCDIDPDGRFHDGLYDAINTAKLIEKLELDPDFTVCNYEKEIDAAAEPLNFSMGDLFANLGIQCFA